MTVLRWAIAQPRMHWTLAENLAETLAALDAAAAAGARGCVGPELALTGFHRRMPEQMEAAPLAAAEAAVREACARRGLAAAFGLPTRAAGGAVFNSHLFIDDRGCEVARVHKRGLTPSEAGFFTPGGARTWAELGGAWVTSVLCRETLDGDSLVPELRAALPGGSRGPRLILWPSYIGESDPEQAALCEAYREGARALARALGAWVLQSNWPEGCNQPGVQGFGASVVLAPDGSTVAVLPRDAATLQLVALD